MGDVQGTPSLSSWLPPPPGLWVRVPTTPAPAFWHQGVWRGGLEAAEMLIPVVEGPPLEEGKRRERRTQPPGVAVGAGGPRRGARNRQPGGEGRGRGAGEGLLAGGAWGLGPT